MADDGRRFLVGVALGILLATALRALLSTLFYLSLATLRLNGTAAWSLVLLAPALGLVLPRSRWFAVLAGLAVALLPFARFTDAFVPVAALATGAALVALAQRSSVAWLGALVGVTLDGAVLLVGGSHDAMLTAGGSVAALALTFLAAWRPPATVEETRASAGVAWAALLVVEVAFLATPFTLARQTGLAPWAAALLPLLGLLLGATLLRRAPGWLVAPLGLVALLDVSLWGARLPFLSVLALHAALGSAATRLPRPHPLAFALAFAPVTFGLLFFGQVLGPLEWRLVVPALAALPLVALFLPAGRVRLSLRRAIPVALAGLILVPLVGSSSQAVEPNGTDELTVVDWNVHQGFGNRGALDPQVYADALRAMRPDVLILQEADTTRLSSGGLDIVHYLARELGLHPVARGDGVAILSRFPSAPNASVASPQGWTAEAALDVHGRVLWVQGVHLARSSAERQAQVEAILSRANETSGPRLLAGDLNSCPTATCFGSRPSDGVHERLGAVYADAWGALHEPDDPAGNTHPSWEPRRRIDVVLLRGLDVLESGPLRDDVTILGSDHLPMRARVRLVEEPGG